MREEQTSAVKPTRQHTWLHGATWFWMVIAILPLIIAPGYQAIAQVETEPPQRIVLFVPGIGTDTQQARANFQYARQILSSLPQGVRPDRYAYFSYARRWFNDDYEYPDYTEDDTKSGAVVYHQYTLSQMVDRLVLESGGSPKIDIIGYSLGGVVATQWASFQIPFENEQQRGASRLRYIHRVIVLDSPLGGINHGVLAPWPSLLGWKFGHAMDYLWNDSENIRLDVPRSFFRADIVTLDTQGTTSSAVSDAR